MKRNKDQIQLPIEPETFHIFQFVKIEGIRGKYVYKKSRFVSPIFGRSVKDVVTVPFTVKDTGDTTRRFDAFRTKAKLTEDEAKRKYGNKYYEFTNIVSNKTRAEYFGGASYVETEEEVKEENKKYRIIRPITKKPVDAPTEKDEMPFKVHPEPKKVAQIEPVVDEKPVYREPVVETYRRPSAEAHKPIVSSFFGDQKDDEFEDVSARKPIYFPKAEDGYHYPSVRLFSKKDRDLNEQPQWLLDQIDVINKTMTQFGIEGEVSGSKKGPTVTRYEIALEPGVNVKRISNIQDNLMMNLASKSLRIEAPIPGKPYVGLEVPNVKPEIVAFGNVVDTKEFLEDKDHPLKVALGVDIDGENIYLDIQSMPHGLIAGATNSGKSVCVNTVLISLLIKNSPDDLKLILIDPKMVELTPYNDLPHLITPVITDAKMAAAALNWAVNEMEQRYQNFANSRSR
ncbi:MAG: DNA translocase FtsK, partial [Acholeplasmataceae bacterium]|nr:DNA translocase FtsK [Acholeplasmataceae bacterium]